MDYNKVAKDILDNVGGKANVKPPALRAPR